jgi:ABC-2 type transport system ATP-binding protein
MGTLASIDINNISKKYKTATTESLSNVSFSIKAGKTIGILGPNGAGKTTLISILCGLIEATLGSVSYQTENNKTITGVDLKKIIGFVPQEYAFYHELTPVQNMNYFGSLYNLSKDEIKEKTDSLLSILGLTDVANKRINTFSGGMKRKINLAIGLIHNPAILFLDEPTVGVDVQSKLSIIAFLKAIRNQGTTIIYTSHHLSEAEDFCDELLLISKGKIVANGSTKKLIEEYKSEDLQSLFIKLTVAE